MARNSKSGGICQEGPEYHQESFHRAVACEKKKTQKCAKAGEKCKKKYNNAKKCKDIMENGAKSK